MALAVVGTLLLASLVGALAASAFFYAAWAFWRTRPSSSRGVPARAFVTYWVACGAFNLLNAILGALASFGVAPFPLFLVAKDVGYVLAATGLAGLAFYLLYLFTGSARWLWPTAVFYAGVCLATVYYSHARDPGGVLVGAWKTDLAYAEPLSTPATVIVLLFLLPQILGAVAYGTLAWRAKEPVHRYRVGVLSTAIFVWFASALAAELSHAPFWQLVTRLGIGLAVAAAVVLAYAPPGPLQARFPPSPEALLADEERRLRKEAQRRELIERARELV